MRGQKCFVEKKNLTKKNHAENMKKTMGAVYLLPANFHPNWAGLAVLFSRQLPKGSHYLFHIFSIPYFLI